MVKQYYQKDYNTHALDLLLLEGKVGPAGVALLWDWLQI